MKSRAENHGGDSSFLEQHTKSDHQIKDETEPVNYKEIDLLVSQD